jgi:hypothetical protein
VDYAALIRPGIVASCSGRVLVLLHGRAYSSRAVPPGLISPHSDISGPEHAGTKRPPITGAGPGKWRFERRRHRAPIAGAIQATQVLERQMSQGGAKENLHAGKSRPSPDAERA